MSIKVQSYVWENSKQKGGCLLVLLAIADFADDAGQAYPSVETLAKKARLSERQAHYVLKQLQDDGEIAIHPNQGPKGCNLYAIKLNAGVQKPRGAKTSGVQSSAKGGAVCDKKGVQPTAPKPSVEPSKEPPSQNNKRERATILPENFQASEPPEKLKGSFTPEQLTDEFEQFTDYHTAKGTKFKDWNAGWRTWLRNAVRFRGGPQRKRALRAVPGNGWDGDSQLDAPGYAWKPKPMSFDEKIRELMDITGWDREAAIAELELKGHGPNGRTAAAA